MFVSQQLNVFIMHHIYPSQTWWEKYSIIWSNTPRGNGLRSIKFYCVDVNDVPAILLKRAEVSKMPTIQLWRNKEKEGEVIGGDTAVHVMDQIRAMLTPNIS
jgi:hypothetical protein